MEQIFAWLKERKVMCGLVFTILLSVTFMALYIVEVTAEETYTCPKTEENATTVAEEESYVVIDIKGAVANPGVYKVTEGTIVNDVIVMAGGLTEDADTSNLNLSKTVSNEMVITVYTKEEVAKEDKLDSIVEADTSTSSGTTTTTDTTSSLVNINTASLDELMTLPGIGEAKAQLIIDYRENCGSFTSKEELMNIKGIGESVYAKLEEYITI